MPMHTKQQSPPARQPSASIVTPAVSARQTQPHQLLSTQYARGQAISQSTPAQVTSTPAPAPAPVPSSSENDLFSLDFHAPPVNATTPTTAGPAPRKDTKQDILSLFGAQAAPSPWSHSQPQSQPLPPFSNATSGSSSTTNWNVGHNWSNPALPVQVNVWGATTPAQQPPLLDSGSDIWGESTGSLAGANASAFGSSASARNTQTNKEDVFGDIWGSFK